MLNIKRIIIGVSLIFIVTTFKAVGQTRERLNKTTHTVWFACITELKGGLSSPISIVSDKRKFQVELPNFQVSESVKLKSGNFRITRSLPKTFELEEIKRLTLCKVKIPANMSRALVLLQPIVDSKGRSSYTAKVQRMSNFKGGDRLYVNLSDYEMKVSIGAKTVRVAPSRSAMYGAPDLHNESKSVPIMHELFHPKKKKWIKAFASTTVLRPKRRRICVFRNGRRMAKIKKHYLLFTVAVKK